MLIINFCFKSYIFFCNLLYYLINYLSSSRSRRIFLIIYQNFLNFFLMNDKNCVWLITFYTILISISLSLKSGFDKIIMSWFSMSIKKSFIVLKRFIVDRFILIVKKRSNILSFNKKEKKENEKNLNISINLILKNIIIKENFNTSHLTYLMILCDKEIWFLCLNNNEIKLFNRLFTY